MKERVIEAHSGNLHAEIITDGEITGCQSAGMMHLAEKDGLARSMQAPPSGDPSLESSPRGIGELAWVRSLQPLEESVGFEPRLGFQPGLHFIPNFGERIDSCAILPR